MKREEFEAILKRSLELQSLQTNLSENEFSTEDLQAASERLGIKPEILQKAARDVANRHRRFRVRGSPEQVQEAFLRHFLMNETSVWQGGKHQLGPQVKIDRESVRIGDSSSLRVVHPAFSEVYADLRFSPDGPNHTTVSWQGNPEISTQKAALIAGIPMLGIGMIPFLLIFIKTGAVLGLLPVFFGLLFAAVVIFYSLKTRARGMEKSLTTYFENVQMLGDLEEQKATRAELESLRKKDADRASPSETEAKPSAPQTAKLAEMPVLSSDAESATRVKIPVPPTPLAEPDDSENAPPPRPRERE